MVVGNNRKTIRAQSAMEYLMTYGWAILIIAIVLVALFSLGVFSGQGLNTACIALSGYICSNPIYSHSTGNLIVTVGQATGTSWATANIVYVPQGTTTSSGVPSVTWSNPPGNYLSSGLVSGQTASVTLYVSGAVNTGTTADGSIWAQYTESGTTSIYYSEIGTVTLKAV